MIQDLFCKIGEFYDSNLIRKMAMFKVGVLMKMVVYIWRSTQTRQQLRKIQYFVKTEVLR